MINNREAGLITISFNVDARTAHSLMALYELLDHGLAITLDDPSFATKEDDWPHLWSFWIETFMGRLRDGELSREWNEKQKRFISALYDADRGQYGEPT